jgi:hypothetical protein
MRTVLGVVLALAVLTAHATDANHVLEVEDDAFAYTVRTHPAGAHLLDAEARLSPDAALNTAKLLNRYLSAGDIEEAALLSNEPKRRFEVLRDFRDSVGENEFKRVFTRYFYPENRLVAEVLIPPHSLLIWELADEKHLAGQYYMQIEDRWLLDDVPSQTRTRLRQVLERFRAAKR